MTEHPRTPESLLRSSPAFRDLDEGHRRKLLADTAVVVAFISPVPGPPRAGKGSRMPGARRPVTRPIVYPEFVRALLEGTFQALVDASIEQMNAYAALLEQVAREVDEFHGDFEQRNEVSSQLELELRKIFEHGPSAETA
jgi:hypothetical protein